MGSEQYIQTSTERVTKIGKAMVNIRTYSENESVKTLSGDGTRRIQRVLKNLQDLQTHYLQQAAETPLPLLPAPPLQLTELVPTPLLAENGTMQSPTAPSDLPLTKPTKLFPEGPIHAVDFETIFTLYQGRIFSYVMRFLRNQEQAEDLTQTIFLNAYKGLGKITEEKLNAWIYKIAYNATMDVLRKRKLIEWIPFSVFEEIGEETAENTHRELGSYGFIDSTKATDYHGNDSQFAKFENGVAERELIQRIFLQLPPKDRVCLDLYENRGFSCEDVGKILDISPSAVKMRCMRARAKFIALYKQEHANPIWSDADHNHFAY
jgi:RNA polymerase sigma-70 factor (ECF subfamily)